jgi:hypothetical protein
MFSALFDFAIPNFTWTSLLVTILGLIILWIVVSIPVWIAGKVAAGGKASFGDALVATLVGPIVYFLVNLLVVFLLSSVLGSAALVFGYILALIAWVWVYKASFETSWIQAILIAILAWLVFIGLSVLVGTLFGVMYPSPFFPKI